MSMVVSESLVVPSEQPSSSSDGIISIQGITKRFGTHTVLQDVSFDVPRGKTSAVLGPSGTGKSVLLKCVIGLLAPEAGQVYIDGDPIVGVREKEVLRIRRKIGVLFQDGALFGSMNLFDNIAFPLVEHTNKTEKEIREIVLAKSELVGLGGHLHKLPGEVSGGMRKRAGLARALVLDPQIILCDEPDSGLDPVRTAYISQLLLDINAEIDATLLIVTHNISIARTIPDNIGMLYRRELVMFGPREVLLTSEDPAVKQFINGRRIGPIGMTEEKDEATIAQEQAMVDAGHHHGGTEEIEGIIPQVKATPGLPPRKGVQRRRARVREILHTLPPEAQRAILKSLADEEDDDTQVIPTYPSGYQQPQVQEPQPWPGQG
jgi:phospholipid/cholesterol/gamma-HCH transport system ATP-binding protein